MSKATPLPPTFDQVVEVCRAARHSMTVSVARNGYARPEFALTDEWRTWDAAIETGRCVMVGRSVPMAQYLDDYTYAMRGWQRLAYEYCMWHPTHALHIENHRKQYRVSVRGDHVEILLPYADYGGERCYVSHDSQTRVLVEVD